MSEGTQWGRSGRPVAATDGICLSRFLCRLPRPLAGTAAARVPHTHPAWDRDGTVAPVGSRSSRAWATPAHPSHHPQARLCPCPAVSGKERALSTSYFPVGLYFSFHHLLTWDMEIRAGVQRAEKVLSIFFPSCRHQKGIAGSVALCITAGFDPLIIGDINLLPLSFPVWVSILSCVLKFLRRKCKQVHKLVFSSGHPSVISGVPSSSPSCA